jgi:vacuolar-type H+-ATPase subunit I/STV1
MYIFILLSLHIGMLAIITGTALAARDNWRRRRWVTSIIGGLHMSLWFVAWVGVLLETIGGVL